MNKDDYEGYRSRYVSRLAEFGHDPRSLGWSKGKQEERFAALTAQVPYDKDLSILDVGCGFGDLYGFLKARGYRGHYLGVDFIPELIATGKKAYPDAHLEVRDIATMEGERTFDVVVASGIFNGRLTHEDQMAHIERTLGHMFRLSRFVAAADFMSSYVDFQQDGTFYARPEDIFSLGKRLTKRVRLVHDHLPFEFAVMLFRDDRTTPDAKYAEPLP